MISNRFKAEAVAPMDLNKYPYSFPHSAAPSHNLQQVDLESVSSACDFFYEFPYSCDFPVPPFPPFKGAQGCPQRDGSWGLPRLRQGRVGVH